ncbi:MAG: DNA polymerase III subunit gamma/tau, partial [Clostridia bacterium]|nr:DNA polymerase III subunit gamma/tau [Clostridia bacterium]
MSETLYLKWRPRTFRDVVGQGRVVEVLKNQSATERFAHAYLLCGTRGTGKTTCARILAKAVNCRHKVDGDPCGVCDVCRGIENGDYLDVIEMDAASNNGIEDMRDLKEKSIYNPSGGGKKVYIIDEVHMLSTSAFNGFLKLLEEPPEHVVFILATTDVQKLPATIISRCQRFDFRRIGEEDIARRCLYVAGEEGIDLTEDGAMKIASLSDGALRNAISALEQLSGAGGRIDEAVVSEVLGLAGSEKLLAVASAVARCETGEAMDALDAMYQRGVSANHFLGDLAMIFRDAAITKAGAGAPLLGSGYDRNDLDEIAGRLGYERLIYHIGEINQAIAGLRTSANARVDTELCLIRLCNPVGRTPQALAARLDALEKKLSELELNPPAPREAPAKREA